MCIDVLCHEEVTCVLVLEAKTQIGYQYFHNVNVYNKSQEIPNLSPLTLGG